ncbi:hypothetical protein [Georgenia sp. SUBG003]|uniref:hypothetical protein n=1 Tax=Georgenia sp. SUBG003 TaxID=1497974 RepID=UPI003AB88D10
MTTDNRKHLVLMGVAGSGKTTIAEELVERLGWVSAEADEFHPRGTSTRWPPARR